MAVAILGKPISTKAPNLPVAPTAYDQKYQDQLNNILRLYFNQIDKFPNSIPGGGTIGGSRTSGATFSMAR